VHLAEELGGFRDPTSQLSDHGSLDRDLLVRPTSGNSTRTSGSI